MKIIKFLFITLCISTICATTGVSASAYYHFSQVILASYSGEHATTVTKATNSIQKLEVLDSTVLGKTAYRAIQARTVAHQFDYDLGSIVYSPWTGTLSKNSVTTLPNASTSSSYYGTTIGQNILFIRTKTSYSDNTRFWGNWYYDI